ncbi:MAG: TIGR00269 family protein [Candidatus Methanomethylicia archaeon]
MKCTKCRRRQAVYLRSYSGEMLCRFCFKRSLEVKVKNTISKYRLLSHNDSILIAVSGGKDSLTLLKTLWRIESRIPSVTLAVLTIDEGATRSYRAEGLKLSRKICEDLKIPHYIVSFKEYVGYTLKELWSRIQEKKLELLPCSYCGVLRRRIMNTFAKDHGFTKIATGHNLDDEVQTFIMNIMRGDYSKLFRFGASMEVVPGFIPRIKPLRYIPEKEIAFYAFLEGFKLYETECPYVHLSMRDEIRFMLNDFERRYPGIKFSIMSVMDKLSKQFSKLSKTYFKTCISCGEPTSRDKCRVCEIMDLVST